MLVSDDHSTFYCHKTCHNGRTGGDWYDDGTYAASGQESMCAGAKIYLEKLGRPRVGMRVGGVLGMSSPDDIAPHFDAVIESVNLARKISMVTTDESAAIVDEQ